MNNHTDTTSDVERDAGETRERWERPCLTRLATRYTTSAPGAGNDGGTGFNQMTGGSISYSHFVRKSSVSKPSRMSRIYHKTRASSRLAHGVRQWVRRSVGWDSSGSRC